MGTLNDKLDAVKRGWKQWKPGDTILINRIMWGDSELANVLDVFERDWFAFGHYVKEFEAALNRKFGPKFHLTNSGSTALETAVVALISAGKIKQGDLVLHPALTFNTSAACFAKYGLKPLFIDSVPGTYNADPRQITDAVNDFKVKLVVMPHLLGNTTDLDVMGALPSSIPIIGDSCDTMGTRWDGHEVGELFDMTAYSFYGSHHITTAGVGGALQTNLDYSELAKSIIYWGRDWEVEQTFANRYSYLTLGSDYQMTEIQAAFGLAQLEVLDDFNTRRKEIFGRIDKFMRDSKMEQFFILPKSYAKCEPSWFGYPLTLKPLTPFTREQLIDKLLAHKIECRPMFSGNTMYQKAWKSVESVAPYSLDFAITAYSRSFFLPAWAMPYAALNQLTEAFKQSVDELCV